MDRPIKPYNDVIALLGDASTAWEKLVGYIRFNYEMDENWAEGKPTHKHFNNLFIKRSGKALLSLHLRDGFFLVSVTFGGNECDKFEKQRASFGETVRNEYDTAEILHDGKWLGFEVRNDSLIDDIIHLVQIKRKPNRKVFPKDIEKCGRLDIGMSHDQITKCIMT